MPFDFVDLEAGNSKVKLRGEPHGLGDTTSPMPVILPPSATGVLYEHYHDDIREVPAVAKFSVC